MAEVILNTKHQQRNDTAANWLLVNPILLRGELGVELDTGKMKIGKADPRGLPCRISVSE